MWRFWCSSVHKLMGIKTFNFVLSMWYFWTHLIYWEIAYSEAVIWFDGYKNLFPPSIPPHKGIGSTWSPVRMKPKNPFCLLRYHLSRLVQRIGSYLETTQNRQQKYNIRDILEYQADSWSFRPLIFMRFANIQGDLQISGELQIYRFWPWISLRFAKNRWFVHQRPQISLICAS